MAYDPSCYVCGHAPEEHRNGDSECEFEDGCDCICFEAREDEETSPDHNSTPNGCEDGCPACEVEK